MGGNAFKNHDQRRVSKEEYSAHQSRIIPILDQAFPEFKGRFLVPLSYRDKPDYGDLDILTDFPVGERREEIFNLLDPEAFVNNGNGMSLLIEGFQVDFSKVKPWELNSSFIYFSWNDLGNLMGKIYHKFGLKYGHRGLTMPLREGTHQFSEIEISQDHANNIFPFLDLDFNRFQEGFDTLEDVYQFVVSSKYFNPDIFKYENLNHTNRCRDKKRPTYSGFLAWIKEQEGLPSFNFSSDKQEYLAMIFEYFPGSKERYQEEVRKLEERRILAERINGKLISEWIGLIGSSLGEFIARLKDKYGNFNIWAKELSEDEIKQIVIREFSELTYESQS